MKITPSLVFERTIELLSTHNLIGGKLIAQVPGAPAPFGYSIDGAIHQVVTAFTDNANQAYSLESKCHTYLWGVAAGMPDLKYKPTRSDRGYLHQRIADALASKPKDALTFLLTAQMMALSEEQPIEKVKKDRKKLPEEPSFDTESLIPHKTLRRWHDLLQRIEYSRSGHIRKGPEEHEIDRALEEMWEAL